MGKVGTVKQFVEAGIDQVTDNYDLNTAGPSVFTSSFLLRVFYWYPLGRALPAANGRRGIDPF